jgi:hypothetical protein
MNFTCCGHVSAFAGNQQMGKIAQSGINFRQDSRGIFLIAISVKLATAVSNRLDAKPKPGPKRL